MNLTFPIRSTKLSMSAEVTTHLLHRQSEFQAIDIYDTPAFGKVLCLDGHVQLAELDESAYHESLVHIPLLSIENPQRALVVGGGDGGVLRELCRHPLREIHMVEIDQGVIDASREYLPELSAGAFDDPRVTVFIQDAFPFAKQISKPYDLIVMDSTDVYEEEDGGLSASLWTEEFYRDLHRALSPSGFVVTQADNLVFCPYSLEGILRTFGQVFEATGHYQVVVPSFGGFSGYAWASRGARVSPTIPASTIPLTYLNDATYRFAMNRLPFSLSSRK